MDIFEKYCGKLTFRFLTLFIAVPGMNVWYRKIFVTFCVLVLSFATIFQVLKFVTEGFTLKLLVVLLPTTVAVFGCLVYVLYLTFGTKMKFQYECILSIMRFALNQERTAEENAIREQYINSTKMFINMYTTILILMVCGMSVSGLVPGLLDFLLPLRHTRKKVLLYDGEMFIDQEKYFYYIYFVECLSAVVTCIVVVVSVNMSVIITQYICGMSAILGYQLENLTEIKDCEISEKSDYQELLTRRLQMCIKSHQLILHIRDIAIGFYDIPLTLILIGTFCTLTMSLVQVTDPDLISLKIIVYTIGQTIQLFLVSCMGQYATDTGLQTSENAYNAKWDTCPTKVQKMLQMTILRSSKPCLVMARGLYVLSIENFMSVIQTVTSCYMVLRHSR